MTLPLFLPHRPDHGCRHISGIGMVHMLEGQIPFSLIIIVHAADDGETQMLTKSPGLCSSAEKW
jgi:hypothetical protein